MSLDRRKRPQKTSASHRELVRHHSQMVGGWSACLSHQNAKTDGFSIGFRVIWSWFLKWLLRFFGFCSSGGSSSEHHIAAVLPLESYCFAPQKMVCNVKVEDCDVETCILSMILRCWHQQTGDCSYVRQIFWSTELMYFFRFYDISDWTNDKSQVTETPWWLCLFLQCPPLLEVANALR